MSTAGAPAQIPRIPWTHEEDEELKRAVALHGDKRWSRISAYVPGRTSKACSHRWRTYLQPGVTHASCVPFSDWEKAVVKEAHKAVGNNWAVIARMLPGRTNAAVKNFWYVYKRRANRAPSRRPPAGCSTGGTHQGPEGNCRPSTVAGSCTASDCDDLESADEMDYEAAYDDDCEDVDDGAGQFQGAAEDEYCYEETHAMEGAGCSTAWQAAGDSQAHQQQATSTSWLQAQPHRQQVAVTDDSHTWPDSTDPTGQDHTATHWHGEADLALRWQRGSCGGADSSFPASTLQLRLQRQGVQQAHPQAQLQQQAMRSCEPRRSSHHSWSGAPRCIETAAPSSAGHIPMQLTEVPTGSAMTRAPGAFGSSGGSTAELPLAPAPAAAVVPECGLGILCGPRTGPHHVSSTQLFDPQPSPQQFPELYCRQITTTTSTAATAGANGPESPSQPLRAVLDLSSVDDSHPSTAAAHTRALRPPDRSVPCYAAVVGADSRNCDRAASRVVHGSDAAGDGRSVSGPGREQAWGMSPEQVQALMDAAVQHIQGQHTSAPIAAANQQPQHQQQQRQVLQDDFLMAQLQHAAGTRGGVHPLWEVQRGHITRLSRCSDGGTAMQPDAAGPCSTGCLAPAAQATGLPAAGTGLPSVERPSAVDTSGVPMVKLEQGTEQQQQWQQWQGARVSSLVAGRMGPRQVTTARRFLMDLSDEGLGL